METTRISVDVPVEMKVKLQLITTQKRAKINHEIKKMIDAYIKRNEKFLRQVYAED